jgi:hypothetical protein
MVQQSCDARELHAHEQEARASKGSADATQALNTSLTEQVCAPVPYYLSLNSFSPPCNVQRNAALSCSTGLYALQHSLTSSTTPQVKELETKCKEARDELKAAREQIDRLQAQIADMVPRADVAHTRKVYVCICQPDCP